MSAKEEVKSLIVNLKHCTVVRDIDDQPDASICPECGTILQVNECSPFVTDVECNQCDYTLFETPYDL